jgi:hypothetical protein
LQILELALIKSEAEPDAVRFRAYVLRADVAVMLDDAETLEQYVLAAQKMQLTETEKLELIEEIERLRELEHQIQKVV